MLRPALFVLALLLVSSPALAQGASVPLPDLSHTDVWTYQTSLTSDGGTTSATSTVRVTTIENISIGTTEHAAYRVETTHEGARMGESSVVWYDTSTFAKVRVSHTRGADETIYTMPAACREWRFPLVPGASWSTSCTFDDAGPEFTIHSNWTVRGPETVTVPAGTYTALVLEQKGADFTERWWFARETCLFAKHESLDAAGAVIASERLVSAQCTPATTTGARPTPTASPAAATPTGPVATPILTHAATATPTGAPTTTTAATVPATANVTRGTDTPGAPVALVLVLAAALALARKRS